MQTARRFLVGTAIAVLAPALFATQACAEEKNLAGMYSVKVLQHWKGVFESHVRGQLRHSIAPYLNATGHSKLQGIQSSVLVEPERGYLFDYRYDRKARTVYSPVFAMKFLYDMLATITWLQAAGYKDQTSLYMVALKYKDAGAFPGGRYLSPLEVFGIPHNELLEVKFDTMDEKVRFEEYFNSAMAFIVAHEVGHDFDDDFDRHSPTEREGFADVFAAEMLALNEFSYVGVISFLASWVLWEKKPADFATRADYARWLSGRAEHPMSSDRVALLGRHLLDGADTFFPPSNRRNEQIRRARAFGTDLIGAAAEMKKIESRTDLRQVGERLDVRSLHVSKQPRATTGAGSAAKPLPEAPQNIQKGPPLKLSDISASTDLVKLSGTWWYMTLNEFPSAVGLRPGEYNVLDHPSDKGRKVLFPTSVASQRLWSPVELKPAHFTFDAKSGLVEISGFLTGKQKEFVALLTGKYGGPTRLLTALDFVTYLWEYDQSAVSVNFMSFIIYPVDRPR